MHRDYLTFIHDERRVAIPLDAIVYMASTPNGASVEILFGGDSEGLLVPTRIMYAAVIRPRVDAWNFVFGPINRDAGPSAETLARECAAAVAMRKLGDTPRECSPKGMSLGSIIPHHPPADPTDATTLTGDELPDELDSREWVGAAGLNGEKFGPTPDRLQ